MPSPIGHALAGISVAWAAPRSGRAFTMTCALLAASPDIDVLFGSHRGPTHSFGAVVVVAALAALIAHARNVPVARLTLVCCAAYSSHLLLDWLGRDTATPYGIMAFWPFSSRYYSSGAELFLEISRRYWRADEFVFGNLRSLAFELALLGPLAVGAYLLRRKKNVEYRMSNVD